jgi:CubicO group peptidase (beta-lactamase class C family)
LIEEGKVNEYAPVSKYFKPEHPIWNGKIPSWADQVTIHDLLTHASGMPDYVALKGHDELCKEVRYPLEVIRSFIFEPLRSTRGMYDYSGAGYNLLGAVIREVAEKPYWQYMADQFFQPFEMDKTSAEAGFYENINMSVCFGEASIVSTVADLYRWSLAFFEGKAVSQASVEKMTTPCQKKTEKICMGRGIFIDQKQNLFFHAGQIGTHKSMLIVEPKRDIHVILMGKDDKTFELAYDALHEVLNSY